MAAFGTLATISGIAAACRAAITAPGPTPAPSAVAPIPPTVAPATSNRTPGPSPEAELRIYGWDGYLAGDSISSFEKRYGIKVTYESFVDEPTQLDTLRRDGRGGGYDVSYVGSTAVPGFVQDGIVRPVDPSLVPNLANLAPEWQSPGYDPDNRHSIPNYWWTTGYAWDPAKLPGAYTRWADLWSSGLDGRLGMLDDMRQAFAAGALVLGLDPNTTDESDLDAILAKLQELRPHVGRWTFDPIGDIQGSDIWITQCSSRDWSHMTPDLPDAQYVIPAEGAVRGNDTLAILSGARHPIAAHLWLDYSLEPQVAANNANAIGSMSPNGAALDLLDAAIKGDLRLNPPADVVARLHDLAALAPADLDRYTERWDLLRAPAP